MKECLLILKATVARLGMKYKLDFIYARRKRLLDPQETIEELDLETSLRPRFLRDYIGQESIKANLDIALAAAKQRKEPIEHVLLYGAPGLGKTTLAHVIANEMGANIRITLRSGD